MRNAARPWMADEDWSVITIATAVGIALAALVLGYLIGRARSPSRTVVWREDPPHRVASQGGAEADG